MILFVAPLNLHSWEYRIWRCVKIIIDIIIKQEYWELSFVFQRDGSVSGTLDLHLKWQYTYIPPKASTKTPAQVTRMSMFIDI